MSHWNYRVVKYKDGDYGLHEAYYGVEDRPLITERAIIGLDEPLKESFEETVRLMSLAFNKPVLAYETREEIPNSVPCTECGQTGFHKMSCDTRRP